MIRRRVAGAPLDFGALRTELEVPGDFAVAVLAEAAAAAGAVRLPEADLLDVPFVTVDPAGSMDLDQALWLGAAPGGYLVRYAIADVAAFVTPGSELAEETFRRAETIYFPDARVPLHPPVLSEGAASLLPGQVRPALVWTFHLDANAALVRFDLQRARVRSRAQLDYAGLQAAIDAGRSPEPVALLPEVGRLLVAASRARHAIELDLPEQRVVPAGDGWTLQTRTSVPVERFNAQISVLTGMAAAQTMLDAGVGILRVVPVPADGAIRALRRAATALGVSWPHGAEPGDVLAGLDPTSPRHAAFVDHAASLLRGSQYVTFEAGMKPATTWHAGVGAPYAHVTAPLRRLADRFAGEICLAVHADRPVPEWASAALARLPHAMAHGDQLAHTVDRAVVDATEAWLLQDRIGEVFPATVIAADDDGATATIVLDAMAVRARCAGTGMTPGDTVDARLLAADVTRRMVAFERV
jgi:exoribonuclease R